MIKEREERLSPVLKYPGGKEKELRYILPNLPKQASAYYEPFVGGGAVYGSIAGDAYYINDKSEELIGLYRMIQEQNVRFLERLAAMDDSWAEAGRLAGRHTDELLALYAAYKAGRLDVSGLRAANARFADQNAGEWEHLSGGFPAEARRFGAELEQSLNRKLVRMKRIEGTHGELAPKDVASNLECVFKTALYMQFRSLYNRGRELGLDAPSMTALYFFVREFCYASMFRYNAQGEFNVPYGGISYNKKSLLKKARQFTGEELVRQLNRTVIENLDFEEFFKKHPPQEDDFVFLDPPYDTEFSTYAKHRFGKEDQERLAAFLRERCQAYFMLVIKDTAFIRSLYPNGAEVALGRLLNVEKFYKNYAVSFQDRNDREAEHLLITNYVPEWDAALLPRQTTRDKI